jgi:vacuolar-type H+-ATPase subunit F/Vma7
MSFPREFKKKVCAIVKSDLEPLMKILGVSEVYTVRDWGEVKMVLEDLVKRDDLSIVVIQKSLVPKDVSFIDLNIRKLYPIVTIIPDDKNSLSEPLQSFYRELIRRYIGYEIHIG